MVLEYQGTMSGAALATKEQDSLSMIECLLLCILELANLQIERSDDSCMVHHQQKVKTCEEYVH